MYYCCWHQDNILVNGYSLSISHWHQGWNDRVDTNHSAEYETNMANFIRDMRSALGKPNLPFVIATTGMDGGDTYSEVEQAQLAMANTTKMADYIFVARDRNRARAQRRKSPGFTGVTCAPSS